MNAAGHRVVIGGGSFGVVVAACRHRRKPGTRIGHPTERLRAAVPGGSPS
jgi:hypothetical protein